MPKNRKKCDCGHRFFCRIHSKIRFVICLKNDAKPKYGTDVNSIIRYSIIPQDHLEEKDIITKMENRLLKKSKENQAECFEGDFNVVLVYDNISDVELERIYP